MDEFEFEFDFTERVRPQTMNDRWQQEIIDSPLRTDALLALALTLPVNEQGNELFGRSHAWYSIASSQARAIMYALSTTEPYTRQMAARALASAGYDVPAAVKEALRGGL